MSGLARWVETNGYIAEGLGGTIGLAVTHAQLGLVDCDRAMHQPYAAAISHSVGAAKVALLHFKSLASRRCGPDQVMELANLAYVAQMNGWDAAATVYRR